MSGAAILAAPEIGSSVLGWADLGDELAIVALDVDYATVDLGAGGCGYVPREALGLPDDTVPQPAAPGEQRPGVVSLPTSGELQFDTSILRRPTAGSIVLYQGRRGEHCSVTGLEQGFVVVQTGLGRGYVTPAALGLSVPVREAISESDDRPVEIPRTPDGTFPLHQKLRFEAFVLDSPRLRSTLAGPGGRVLRRANAGEDFLVTTVENGFARVHEGRRYGYVRADALGLSTEPSSGAYSSGSGPHMSSAVAPPSSQGPYPAKPTVHSMDSTTSTGPGCTLFLLFLMTIVAGAILAMVALFSMPLVTCGPLSMKATDFGDNHKVLAFDLCGKLGGNQAPAPGLWVAFLGSAMFFGGGAGVLVLSRRLTGAAPGGGAL